MNDNGRLNSLQVYQTKWFSGLVDEAMISNALQSKPHVISPILSHVFGKFNENALDYLTKGTGRTMTITEREYEWSLMGEDEKAITIYKAIDQLGAEVTAGGNHFTGIGHSLFKIYLREKWFGPGSVIVFDDRDYSARVMGTPVSDGEFYVYTLQLMGNDEQFSIPDELLLEGREVSRDFSAYEEYSDEADIINFATPCKLRNHLTTVRLSYDITRDAAQSVMCIAIKGDNGKSTVLWAPYQEWQAMKQFYRMLDKSLVYSKYSSKASGSVPMLGTNGRPVYVGAGLREQIAPANKRNYTNLSAKMIEDFLTDISYNSLAQSDRKFVALTGEMGMRTFHDALMSKASNYSLMDTHFVTGSGQNLTLGGQFVTYKMINGVELTLKHFPLYDNTIINRKLHPVTKRPLESYRMTFLDFGMNDGESNIVKVVRQDSDMVMWHTAGSTAPGSGTGKNMNTLRSNAKDGYQVHILSECGLMLRNPLSCGELICDAE